MKVSVSKSKNTTIYYLSKSVRIGNRTTTKTIERIGTYEEIKAKCGDIEPLEWAKQYAARRSAEEKAAKKDVLIKFSSTARIKKDARRSANIGYLFLQDIYYDLGIDKICRDISDKYKFEYDLNGILSMLLYSRIIFPGSKKSSLELSGRFLNHRNVSSIRSTGHWKSLPWKMTSSRHSCTGTLNTSWNAAKGSCIMTARTITLRLNRRMISGNMAFPRTTNRILSYRWACSWMLTVSPCPSHCSAAMKTNSLP